jgi:hypothetical protein
MGPGPDDNLGSIILFLNVVAERYGEKVGDFD